MKLRQDGEADMCTCGGTGDFAEEHDGGHISGM